jgi:hypothetical protein
MGPIVLSGYEAEAAVVIVIGQERGQAGDQGVVHVLPYLRRLRNPLEKPVGATGHGFQIRHDDAG